MESDGGWLVAITDTSVAFDSAAKLFTASILLRVRPLALCFWCDGQQRATIDKKNGK